MQLSESNDMRVGRRTSSGQVRVEIVAYRVKARKDSNAGRIELSRCIKSSHFS